MVNKKAWVRILEASFAILLITGIVLFLYAKQVPKAEFDYIGLLQKQILDNIALNDSLRSAVLSNNSAIISNYVNNSLPENFDFEIKICEINSTCSKTDYIDADIYAKETLISANLTKYDLKKVRLFVWEK